MIVMSIQRGRSKHTRLVMCLLINTVFSLHSSGPLHRTFASYCLPQYNVDMMDMVDLYREVSNIIHALVGN